MARSRDGHQLSEMRGQLGTGMNCGAGALECGGKRKRDTAFAPRVRETTAVRMPRRFPPAIPSESGVALTLPAALQGAPRAFMRPLHFESRYDSICRKNHRKQSRAKAESVEGQRPVSIPAQGSALGNGHRQRTRAESPIHSGRSRCMDRAFSPLAVVSVNPGAMPQAGMGCAFGAQARSCWS